MSRVDPDAPIFYREDRRATVRDHLARIGLSLDDGSKLVAPEVESTRYHLRPAEEHQPEGFATDGERVVSIELCQMMHIPLDVPRPKAPGEPISDDEAELASLEGQRHG